MGYLQDGAKAAKKGIGQVAGVATDLATGDWRGAVEGVMDMTGKGNKDSIPPKPDPNYYKPKDKSFDGPVNTGDWRSFRPKFRSAAPKAAPTQMVPEGTFANYQGLPQDILARRQAALQGFSGGEMAKLREGAVAGIEGQRASAMRDLGRMQGRQGITGGIAFAQQSALANQAMQARANQERDLAIANENYKRQALGDYQDFVGKERYGDLSQMLSGRALDIQEQAGNRQNELLADYLRNVQANGGGYQAPYSTERTRAQSIPDMLSSDRPWYEKTGDLAARSALGSVAGSLSETGYGRQIQDRITDYIMPRYPWEVN